MCPLQEKMVGPDESTCQARWKQLLLCSSPLSPGLTYSFLLKTDFNMQTSVFIRGVIGDEIKNKI